MSLNFGLCKLGDHHKGLDGRCTRCGATPDDVSAQAMAVAFGVGEALRLRIYLSGPMKGYPNANYPLFHAVAGMLRRAGHTVHNPAEFPHDGPPETFPLRQAFAAYAKFICEEADAIVLLPSWEQSTGVSAELALAKNCGLKIFELKDLDLLLDGSS